MAMVRTVSNLLLVSCLLLLLSLSLRANSLEATVEEVYFKIGDNESWKQPTLVHQDWRKRSVNNLPADKGTYWARIHINITGSQNNHEAQQALYLSVLGAYEVYWNGYYLARNGVVGTQTESEVPGHIYKVVAIPNELWTHGSHIISLRISNFNSPKQLREKYFNVFVGPLDEVNREFYSANLLPLFILGALIIVGLYFLQVYLVTLKQASVIIFSVLCFTISLLLIAETWKIYFGYTYDWHYVRLVIIELLTLAIAVLLPTFFIFNFKMKFKLAWLTASGLVVLSSYFLSHGYDVKSANLLSASFLISILIVSAALINKKQGASLLLCALIAITVFSIIFPFSFHDKYFVPSFTLFIGFVLNSLTLQMKQTQVERDQATLTSAHLEIALLRKNIQPHFVLNTLTSIEQWIDESPKTAIKFIHALAAEFRVLNTISNEKQICLQQEIALCESHIEIMSYRKDKTFVLKAINIDPNQWIPPAIVHTLLENALSHNNYIECEVVFTLEQIKDPDKGITTLLLNSPIQRNRKPTQGTGTGFKYICARLKESYGDNWRFENEELNDTWIAKVTIPLKT